MLIFKGLDHKSVIYFIQKGEIELFPMNRKYSQYVRFFKFLEQKTEPCIWEEGYLLVVEDASTNWNLCLHKEKINRINCWKILIGTNSKIGFRALFWDHPWLSAMDVRKKWNKIMLLSKISMMLLSIFVKIARKISESE